MRRWLVLGTVFTLVTLAVAATGCGVVGGATGTAASTKVVAAESLLANRYAGAWWSGLFGSGKNEAPIIGSVQATIGADYSGSTSGSQKTTVLDRLSSARSTVDTLRADRVLSKADADTVLAAIAQIESVVNKP